MARLLSLPLLLASLLVMAAPAPAQVLSGSRADPAERPDDPGRDIEAVSSTYDPAGAWTVAVRFYGAPTAETSALLRVFLGVRAQDGACQGSAPATLMVAYTDPADRGGKGFTNNQSFDLVKILDEDGRGFRLEFAGQALANRGACGIVNTSLSRNEPFDSVGAFEFPGAPSEPPPAGGPGGPGGPGAPGAPGGSDTTLPSARMKVLRDPKALRRGVVRVAVLAASERVLARATLHGAGGVVRQRHGKPLGPDEMVRLALRLRATQMRRLRRTGRLPVDVVTALTDEAGNTAHLRERVTLRYKRRANG